MVLGAGGQLGSDLVHLLSAHPATELHAFTRQDLDLTQHEAVRATVLLLHPGVVINCGAFTKVDECERVPDLADAVNHLAQASLARSCREAGALCVYLSTDYVFDGEKRAPFTEKDSPHPLNQYGGSKLRGEQATQSEAREWLIVRSSWLYGPTGENFPKKILARAKSGLPLRVVDDQTGCPTYTPDLAGALVWLVEHGARGLFHVSNSGPCTWYDFACALLAEAGLSNPVERISSAQLQAPARRPRFSVLDNGKAHRIGMPPVRPWKATLPDLFSTLL